jgi:hypothetical protein
MKGDVAKFVAHCDIWQRVKIYHQKSSGLLQPLLIPELKWEDISMDFISGLPRTQKVMTRYGIIDRLTKVLHFIPMRTTYGGDKLARLYIDNILKLHGVTKSIISDRGAQFVSKFWRSLHQALKTNLDYNSTYHPQTDE